MLLQHCARFRSGITWSFTFHSATTLELRSWRSFMEHVRLTWSCDARKLARNDAMNPRQTSWLVLLIVIATVTANSYAVGQDRKSAGTPSVRTIDNDGWRLVQRLKVSEKPVFCVRFSPDGKLLAAASTDDTLQTWDIERGTSHARYEFAVGTVCLSYSPD